MALLLGIDLGTSACKALLINAQGEVMASTSPAYPLATPRPLWAEQNPHDWWDAAAQSVRALLRTTPVDVREIAAIGLTGQMHGLVLLDAHGRVLRPAILWNDQRTSAQCNAITQQIGAARVLEWIANPILPGFTAPKILWVREHEPAVYAQVAHVLLPKDYLRFRLTGAYATEVSDASGTALFDVRRWRWSDAMLDSLDVPRAWLPECFESQVVSATVSPAAADATGLRAGTPVVGGGGDQAAQAVGSGVVQAGICSATLGTSGVVFAATEQFAFEPQGRLHVFCHALPQQWHLMGVMLSAGGSLRWFRDALGEMERAQAQARGVDVYDLLTAQAASAPPGAEGLLFLPYLSGERTPHPDSDARGAFVGLTLRHGKAHLIRAVLEGVAFGLRDSLELMRALSLRPSEVRASGGGAQSALWRQILADVFDTPIVSINVTEGAAYGAALLAGVGAGVYADVREACAQTIRATERREPSVHASVYDELYAVYRELYPALAGTFKRLSVITSA